MDLSLLMPWLTAAALILSLGNTVTTLLTTGAKQTAKDLTDTKRALTDLISAQVKLIEEHDRRLLSLETEFKHLPDTKTLTDLRLAISEMDGKLGRMEESQLGVSRTVRRMENFLLKQGAAEE